MDADMSRLEAGGIVSDEPITLLDRYDNVVPTTPEERALLAVVKKLFASKNSYGDGATFRVAFVSEIMDGYCSACGRKCDIYCHCTNDE